MMLLRQTLAITQMFLRRFALHPITLTSIFVTPIAIALIFGIADERALSRMPVGVLVQRADKQSESLVHAIDAEPGVVIRRYPSTDALERAVRTSEVAAGVVVARSASGVRIVGDSTDPIFTAARAVVSSVAARGRGNFAVNAPVRVDQLATTKHSRETGRPRAAAGMLVYFVFVTACFTSVSFAEDRARGVIARTVSGPVAPNAVILGEVLGRFILAFVQVVLVAIMSSLLLHATWGSLLPFTILLVVLSAVAAGASVLLGVVITRTGPEAMIVSNSFAAACGLLGGCFWTLAFVPGAMRVLAYVTPHAWALRAIDSLAAQGASLPGIGLDLVVLVGFAAAFLSLATLGLRRIARASGAMA